MMNSAASSNKTFFVIFAVLFALVPITVYGQTTNCVETSTDVISSTVVGNSSFSVSNSSSASNSSEDSTVIGGSPSNLSNSSSTGSSNSSEESTVIGGSPSNLSNSSSTGSSNSNSSEEISSSTSVPLSSSTPPAVCTKPSPNNVPFYVDDTCSYNSNSSQIGTPCCSCGKGVRNLFLKPLTSLSPKIAKPPISYNCPTPKGLCLCSGLPSGKKRCFNSIGGKKLGISIYPYTNSGYSQVYSYQTGCTAGSGIQLVGTAVKFQYLCAKQNLRGKPIPFPLLNKPGGPYFRPTVVGCGGCLNIGQGFTCQGPTAPSANKIFGF